MRSVGANKGYYKLERFKFARDLPWKPIINQLPGVSIQISEQAHGHSHFIFGIPHNFTNWLALLLQVDSLERPSFT
jgi:hypothetical protein